MTPQNLTDYVAVYENAIPMDVCKKIMDNLNFLNWQTHTFSNYSLNQEISFEDDLYVSPDEIPESEYLKQKVWDTLSDYFKNKISFAEEWYDGWYGFTPLRFNKYTPNTRMRLHCDHIQSMFDGDRKGIPTLTVLGTLNKDYEGGEFVLFQDHEVALPEGSLIIFPSNFLFPHEVKKIKKGNRFSFVTWVW